MSDRASELTSQLNAVVVGSEGERPLITQSGEETIDHVERLDAETILMYWSDGTVTETVTEVADKHEEPGEWRSHGDGSAIWVKDEEGS